MSPITVSDLLSVLPALALIVGALVAVGADASRKKDCCRSAPVERPWLTIWRTPPWAPASVPEKMPSMQ